jgi:hypothetical protein
VVIASRCPSEATIFRISCNRWLPGLLWRPVQVRRSVMWPDNVDEEPDDECTPVQDDLLSGVAPPVDNTAALEIFDLFEISDGIRAAYFD